MKVWTWLGLAMLIATTAACGDDGRRSVGDAGGDATIMLMDGGGGDASRPDTSTTTDSGGGSCPPQTLPAPSAPGCAAATLTCLMGCMDQPCLEACFEADPAPMECIGCTNDAIISCATMNGCDDEAGQVVCCGEENCAPGDATCIQSMCAGEIGTFNSCVEGAAGAAPCGQFSTVAVCFPAS